MNHQEIMAAWANCFRGPETDSGGCGMNTKREQQVNPELMKVTFLSAGWTEGLNSYAILAYTEGFEDEQYLIPTDEATCRFLQQNGLGVS